MIHVFIVEDHMIVREGLSSLLGLAPDIKINGMAGSGEEALEALRTTTPDVLLLDIKLPNISGVETLRRLRSEGRLPPTLILTTFEDDTLLLEALHAGAKGYLLKDVSVEQLLNAIREVAAGGLHINPAATDRILRAAAGGNKVNDRQLPSALHLTERERHVLRLIASGYSNREIGRALAMSEGTVKNHVARIFEKLDVNDRTRAALKGLQSGLC
jgi:DNA-binding NarL/FixJ family response regulator